MDILELKKSKNIAKELDEEKLDSIASYVIQGYEYDEETRADWKALNDKAMEMAKQTIQTKDTPWPNSSNVKYPLITKASIDFAARTYPEIIKNNNLVRGQVIGGDPNGEKARKANNVGRFMSYQLLQQCDEWEEGLDISLHTLSIVGTIFKKTYYDPMKRRPVSVLCNPDKVVVDYNVSSLKEARRITHIMHVYKNDIVHQINYGNYLDVDIEELTVSEQNDTTEDPILELLEQHCYLDLDYDGYKEPYIVVLHKASRKVLSIKARFGYMKMEDKKVVYIEAEHWFTDYHFIRNHDGGFYSLGFGILLLPINSAINTTINQLIDSGTLNNLQSGFVGRGIRIKGGDVRPKMGEWKVLDAASGVDLQKNIVPLPTKEPSMVLFNMLNLLIQAGKELTSSSEVTSGQAPPPNVPAAAWLNSVENALKILTAINKRIYKSLTSELKKIFYINYKHLSQAEYMKVLDDPTANKNADFDPESIDIIPVADPSLASATQRVAKIQAIMAMPVPNQEAVTRLYLESLELEPEVIEKLMTPPESAGPPPEALETLAKVKLLEAQVAEIQQNMQLDAHKVLLDTRRVENDEKSTSALTDEAAARIIKMYHDIANSKEKTTIVKDKEDHKAVMSEIKQAHIKEIDAIKLGVDTENKKKDHDLKEFDIIAKTDVAHTKTEADTVAKIHAAELAAETAKQTKVTPSE